MALNPSNDSNLEQLALKGLRAVQLDQTLSARSEKTRSKKNKKRT